MTVDEQEIRKLCTDAVLERGRSYRDEGRICRVDRFADVVTATVEGSQLYEVTVYLSVPNFDAECTCPYSGPGECKHVVAVLLAVTADPLPDESARIEAILADVSPTELRSFVKDRMARNQELRDRFTARFGNDSNRSVEEYRAQVDRLFDEHTADYPVVLEAIDFTRFTELADEYCEHGRYTEAATIYRALAEGIEANMNLVDAAYDHYARTFQRALDGYAACITQAELSDEAYQRHMEVLSERASEAEDYLAERYAQALDELQS